MNVSSLEQWEQSRGSTFKSFWIIMSSEPWKGRHGSRRIVAEFRHVAEQVSHVSRTVSPSVSTPLTLLLADRKGTPATDFQPDDAPGKIFSNQDGSRVLLVTLILDYRIGSTDGVSMLLILISIRLEVGS